MKDRHFVFLDGMRGIAALSVGVLHATINYKLGFHPAHAYLAVDFFFCLSGFIIAYSYDKRLSNNMTIPVFCKRRLIRLYPMILIGIILGFFATIAAQRLQGNHDTHAIVLLLFPTLLLIPVGLLFHHQAFPINNPIWSLFFEVFANLAYAIQQRFFRPSALVICVTLILAAAFLVIVANHFSSVVSIGFSNWKTFLSGFVRVFYPFLAGMLICRFALFKHHIRTPSLLLVAALLAALFLPVVVHSTWPYDSIVIIFLFPTIVAFGCNSTDFINLSQLWKILGQLSYPFYVIHEPVLRIVYVICTKAGIESSRPDLSASIGLVAALVVTYALFRFYDAPVRNWLAKLGQNKQHAVQV